MGSLPEGKDSKEDCNPKLLLPGLHAVAHLISNK